MRNVCKNCTFDVLSIPSVEQTDLCWELLEKVLQRITSPSQQRKHTVLEKGFNILQNIEDRSTLQKHLKRARDPIAMTTVKTKPKESKSDKPSLSRGNNNVLDLFQMGIHSK